MFNSLTKTIVIAALPKWKEDLRKTGEEIENPIRRLLW